MTSTYPKVGVATFILKDGKFLLLRRQGAHGAGTWGLPGGHLEFGETWEEAARREAMEEVGLELKNVRFLAATNDIFDRENRHYVTIFMLGDWASGTEAILEPDKCQELLWTTYEAMPTDVFLPIANLRESLKALPV